MQRMISRNKKKILIIKHGALGDFILSFGPFAAIKKQHLRDHLVLLTTKTFIDFARESNYFDEIIVDNRSSIWNLKATYKLGKLLRKQNFSRIYDLQTSDRTNFYHNFFRMKNYTEWSGTALGCSHPDRNSNKNKIHTIERHKQQLAIIGIKNIKMSDLSWVKTGKDFKIEKPYILICPGASPHRPRKRWPEKCYAEIAKKFLRKGIKPVIVGKLQDAEIANFICMNATGSINLVNQTTIQDLCCLAKESNLAIGNDTGPMHIFAMNGCHSLVLFSKDSDPIKCAPRSTNKRKLVKIIQEKDLRKLSIERVINSLLNDFGYDL